jgi:hypothetical protein
MDMIESSGGVECDPVVDRAVVDRRSNDGSIEVSTGLDVSRGEANRTFRSEIGV